jgi:hypothetical protein
VRVQAAARLLILGAVLLATASSFAATVVASRDAPIYDKEWRKLGTMPKGAEAELLSVAERWYQVRYAPAEGDPIEGWARVDHFEKLPTYVEALRDTPILSETFREIGTLHQGERGELLEIREMHLLMRCTLPDGKTVDGLIRRGDVIDARAADFARKVKESLTGSVRVRRSPGFERRRVKTFGKEKTVVEIVSRSETVWLEIVLASKVPVVGLQISYQFYTDGTGPAGQSQVVEGKTGALAVRASVGDLPLTFRTQFATYRWEDQIVEPDKPAVGRAGVPDYQVGDRYHGYRVQVFWRNYLLKTFEENALPAATQ